MSDIMLFGVLRMPPDLWTNSPIDVMQRHSRYVEAAERIEADAAEIERLRADAVEADALREKLAGILSRTAVALRGPEPPLTRWSWHDLPERAALILAEIERLRTRLEVDPEFPDIDGIYCRDQTIRLQNSELAKLRAEAEALRRDAERYRFLCKDFSAMSVSIDGNHSWAYRRNFSLRGPSLSAAIDAAIAEQALQDMTDNAQALGLYDVPGDEKR